MSDDFEQRSSKRPRLNGKSSVSKIEDNQLSAFAAQAPLPNYPDSSEHLLGRDAQLNKPLPGTFKPEIAGASQPDVAVISGEEAMPVCFGMVHQISISGVLYH